MTLSPLISVLKIKSVKWTLIGLAIAFAGFPLISAVLPYVFPEAKARAGSYHDVVEMKEIDKLSVQRLNFSKVVTVTYPPNLETNLTKATIYIRRIMRGHVTTSVEFSDIVKTNDPNGKVIIRIPPPVAEPFIDEWIPYDSKGTGRVNTKEMSRAMDKAFREAMLKTALQPERVKRAKQHAERIIEMLYPDLEFEPRWSEDDEAVNKCETTEASHEQ